MELAWLFDPYLPTVSREKKELKRSAFFFFFWFLLFSSELKDYTGQAWLYLWARGSSVSVRQTWVTGDVVIRRWRYARRPSAHQAVPDVLGVLGESPPTAPQTCIFLCRPSSLHSPGRSYESMFWKSRAAS